MVGGRHGVGEGTVGRDALLGMAQDKLSAYNVHRPRGDTCMMAPI